MPKPVDPKKAYLEFHGGSWRVSMAVPQAARRIIGSTRLKHNLDTDSLKLANVLKKPHLERFRRRIEEALVAAGKLKKGDLSLALELAKLGRELGRNGTEADREAFLEAVREKHFDISLQGARERFAGEDDYGNPVFVEEERPEQLAHARTFSDVAHGRATPIDIKFADYHAQLFVQARTKADDLRAMRYLREWCAREKVPPMLEEIDLERAYAFADDLKVNTGSDHVTCNKYLGRLSSYWQYLGGRVPAARENVFAKIKLRGPKSKYDEKERPFTDGELATLLMGPAKPHMLDLMYIGALTGARLDVIVRLKVRDTADRCLLFKPQKKEDKPRYVPVHPDLAPAIARRVAGKGPDDDLFPEWPPVRKAGSMRERSFKTSNHFGEYRKACGVTHDVPGKRRSLVNFHSFRRWFISRLEQAGVAENMIAGIVGHRNGTVTLDVYSEGPLMKAARRAVAKVRLPPLDGSPVREPEILAPRRD